MEKITLYKIEGQYYELQKKNLLSEKFKIIKDTKELTIFEKEEKNVNPPNT